MPQPLPAAKAFRFGPFEFDPKSGHLRSEGGTHRLADQPLALLIALLERPGEMVSREELRARLWPDGTFVDFDHGLNSAVSRLREALNDSATTPRFVETIPRRGYRLLVPVETDRPGRRRRDRIDAAAFDRRGRTTRRALHRPRRRDGEWRLPC